MKLKSLILFTSLGLFFFTSCSNPQNEAQAATEESDSIAAAVAHQDSIRKDYEVVFCLDATGSMAGLIQTAKDKIWDIATGIAQSQEVSSVKIGMIFYRDRGDAFITRSYPLTENIDSIYSELLQIDAMGGGDAPESVNQALHEAVDQMKWSSSDNAFRTIFLVGDCPPHMDYDEVKYEESCELANEKHIIINSIKLGTACQEAIPHFTKIAAITQGAFTQIGQHAEDYVIKTPYDDSINYYNYRIDESKIYYGSRSEKVFMYDKKSKGMAFYSDASAEANTARAKYNRTKSGKINRYGKKELVQDVIDKKVDLDSIKKEELPDEFEGLSAAEQKAKLDELKKERLDNEVQLERLIKKQQEFIEHEEAKSPEKASFSKDVLNTLKEQSKKD